jgi:DNA repair ATPase RecN
MTFTQTGPTRTQAGRDFTPTEEESPNIHSMLRLIRNEIASGAPRSEAVGQAKRDFEFSFDLLTKTAEVIDLLQERCRNLEADNKDIINESRADIEAAHANAKQWQEMSSSLKSKLDECARQLTEAKTRAEAAEKRGDALAKRLETSEQRATVAEELARSYHDKIVASVGNASRLQEVLMQISAKEAAASAIR